MMRHKNKAFTLIELLVVIAIIAALVGILSVAQRKVKIVALNLRQKAAFHAGEISLELYSKDFGEYPDSEQVIEGTTAVTGAQRVAEAFFGRDDRGFHPKTKWHPSLDAADLYSNTPASLAARKTPYFERKRAGFYMINDLWGATPGVESTPVFTDVFERNNAAGLDEKVGMPILYFKADSSKDFRTVDPVTNDNSNTAVYKNWIYNFNDNYPLLQLPWLRDPAEGPDGLNFLDGKRGHYKDPDNPGKSNAQVFYELLTQSERDTNADGNPDFFKPHNKSTFLLISAGYDGIYGTKDDLTNFDD